MGFISGTLRQEATRPPFGLDGRRPRCLSEGWSAMRLISKIISVTKAESMTMFKTLVSALG